MTDWQETRSAGVGRGGAVTELCAGKSARAQAQRSEAAPGGDSGGDGAVPANRSIPSQPAFAADAPAARKLLEILDLLQDVPGAQGIHRDAIRALHELQQSYRDSEQYLGEAVDLLLQHQARRCAADPEARTEFELLRRHLRPPVVRADDDMWRRLVAALGACDEGAEPRPDPGRGATAPGDEAPARANSAGQPDGIDGHGWMRDSAQDSADMQQSLSREIRETLTQNEEFGVTLDLVLSELQRARSIEDAQMIRARLLDQVKRLHSGHFALAHKLDSADRYLRMLSLDSRNLNEELHRVRELSLTDELTSLPNRRAFMARVEEEVARVERYGMPLSLAVIDLDRFKSVNDQHGHAAGDEVLRCYATQIFSVFRNHDLVARYGGEEFAVLLPNTDHNGAAAALRKLRECAARVRCRAEDTAFPVPTFSAGVATFKRGESAQSLIDRADEALYQAKRAGRDRVEFATGAMS